MAWKGGVSGDDAKKYEDGILMTRILMIIITTVSSAVTDVTDYSTDDNDNK